MKMRFVYCFLQVVVYSDWDWVRKTVYGHLALLVDYLLETKPCIVQIHFFLFQFQLFSYTEIQKEPEKKKTTMA